MDTVDIACPKCGYPIFCDPLRSPIAEFAFWKLMRWSFRGRCEQCGFEKTFWFVENKRMLEMTQAGAKAIELYMPTLAQINATAADPSHPINENPPLEVQLQDGFLKCPFCRRRFKLSDSNRWDGERHLTCGQRIILKSAP